MARPKRSETEPEARQRMTEAFWELLEDHALHDITIGMVVAKAGCNRGTFYYHFPDKDALVSSVINDELNGANIPQMLFSASTSSSEVAFADIFSIQLLRRLALFMKQGGTGLVERLTKDFVLRMWQAALCADGGELADETRCVVEYCSSGMLGLMAYMGSVDEEKAVPPPAAFLAELSHIEVTRIRKAQGLTEEELRSRLAIVTQMSSMMGG